MLTDIEIAQSCEMQPIGKIAEKLNIPEEKLEPYGRYKAKVDHIASEGSPAEGQAGARHRHQPDARRRRQDHRHPSAWPTALRRTGQKRHAGAARAVAGPGVRHEGRRGGRRLCAGRAHGGYQPALHRRHARHQLRRTTCWPPWWTTTSSRATPWASTRAAMTLEALRGYERPAAAQSSSTASAASPTARRARTGLTSPPPARSWRCFCLASSI